MRIVAITIYHILNKASLLRIQRQPLKNAESLEAFRLKHSELNYFLPLKTAECGFDIFLKEYEFSHFPILRNFRTITP
jgi:hypothetical protein